MIGLGLGIWKIVMGGGGGGPPTPRIRLSNASVPEDAEVGDVIGTLIVSNGVGPYTFAITSDPDSKFAVDGTNLELAATLDYETATSHQVTIEADNGVDTPLTRTFSITVTDVDDTAPTITSSDTTSVEEDAHLAHVLTASEPVTWSVIGGDDEAQFEIAAATLRWVDDGTRDYEDPQDDDGDNDYLVEVRATDGAGNTADQSVTVTVTDVAEGDTTPPVLSSATDVVTGATTADLDVTTDEDNGTLYWVLSSSATPPSAAQVKAGQDHTGSAAAKSGSQAVSAIGEQAVSATALTADTTYYAHFMHEDAAANQSNVASGDGVTTLWTPALLFAGGEVGVLFDPSDLTSMSTTSAGSTPSNVNDPVGRIADTSGGGHNAIQGTSGARPVLKTSGGLYWLESDGLDDFLQATFAISQPWDRISAVRQIAFGSDQVFGGATANFGAIYQVSSGVLAVYSGASGPTVAVAIGSDAVMTERHNGASSRVAVNNGSYATGNAGTSLPGGVTIASGSAVGVNASLRFYGGVMINRALTDAEIAKARTYFGAKAGLTL